MKITIPGKPIPLRRPRINNKRLYDTQTKVKESYGILFKMKQKEPLTGPLTLVCCFIFQYPQAQRKKMKLNHPHSSRPDGDNLLKFIMDAANGILYHDDSQVAHIIVLKCYGPIAKTMIELKPYEDPHEETNPPT